MELKYASLENCAQATGTVVVIDVLRAFSVAAYAFEAGVQDITLVGTVDEAFALRVQMPGALLVGEVDGLPIKGFDFGNSPTALAAATSNLQGQRLIQRTSQGTQGVVRSLGADRLFAGSFCCAQATVEAILRHTPASVTFVITGLGPDGLGEEDMACADYMAALLQGQQPPVEPFLERVRRSTTAQLFISDKTPEFPLSDLAYCTVANQFDFAMPIRRKAGLWVMEAEFSPR